MGHPPLVLSGRDVTAVLGPTNTGKTHFAIDRMLAHESGMIGLPLRLLAREVYGRVVKRIGVSHVALITGEEKIMPAGARYRICTVEAMPRHGQDAFVAIDEVQLAGDFERGLHFTDRILHLRGRQETLLLGAQTMRPVLEKLLPGLHVQTRPRLSRLSYAGARKITRLPRRSAIVAFRADEVYAIAELIRRQRGGAAVVMGALSPRTRNAQVALYQSGDVDFLVATDAIGMGLNLDVDHIAFAQTRKFDGYQFRNLNPAELGQIAGRAGRHLRDGTFGVTGQVPPFEPELVERLEGHVFDAVDVMQWRTYQLDFSSMNALKNSLVTPPPLHGLVKALPAVDACALDLLSQDEDIVRLSRSEANLRLLWDICALPDYRKIAPAQHADIIAVIYRDLLHHGAVNEDYIARQVAYADNLTGEIDTLSQRIAQVRTWTYVANRSNWLGRPGYWQKKTAEVEDKLSDALHDKLTRRFVDRRTSILMRRLRENVMIEAEISRSGNVLVEGHHVGHLDGFRFHIAKMAGKPGDETPQTGMNEATGEQRATSDLDIKTLRATAQKALSPEYEARADRLSLCANGDLALSGDGIVRWIGQPVASLTRGEDFLRPRAVLLADEQLTGAALDKVRERINRFIAYYFESHLKPLFSLVQAGDLSPMARGLAFQLVEAQGVLPRRDVADMVKNMDQDMRASLRGLGVRFGAYHIFISTLLKPAPAQALTLLWSLQHENHQEPGINEIIQALGAGRTSVVVDGVLDPQLYRLAGYRILGRRAVRIDILEKLADLIRVALAWRPEQTNDKTRIRPAGAYDGRQFLVTPVMMSILGASHGDMEEILKNLGYRYHKMAASEVAAKMAAMDATASPLPAPELVGPHFSNLHEAQTEPSQATEDETAAKVEEKSAQKEAEPEKTVLLWRYQSRPQENARKQSATKSKAHAEGEKSRLDEAREKRRSFSKKQKDQKRSTNKAPHKQEGKKQGRTQQASHINTPRHKPEAKARPIDPDSPFAKLAALRDKLKG